MPSSAPHLLRALDDDRRAHRRRVLRVVAAALVATPVATLLFGGAVLSRADLAVLAAVALAGLTVAWLAGRGALDLAVGFVTAAGVSAVGWFHATTAGGQLVVADLVAFLLILVMAGRPGAGVSGPTAALVLAALAARAGRWAAGLEVDPDEWTSVTFDLLVALVLAGLIVATDRRRTDREGERLRAALVELGRREEEAVALRIVAERAAEAERRTNETRGTFLLRVSHELRTPLTAIRGYGELLAEHADPAVQADAARVLAAAQRLAELVDGVLALTSDADAPAPRPVPLRGLLDSVAQELGPKARAGNTALTVDAVDAAVPLSADVVRRVLVELTRNALRATPGGHVHLAAAIDRHDVRFDVIDDGSGIPSHRLPTLFEPFAGSSAERGTGLGLAVSARRLRALGGALTATSGPGGTRLTARLPLADGAQDGVSENSCTFATATTSAGSDSATIARSER